MKTILCGALTAVVCLGSGIAARAQEMPNWGGGLNDILQQNLAFDGMMDLQARQYCQNWYLERQAYRARTGDYGYIPGPVSPMDVHRSINGLNDTYYANNAAWHDNSARMGDAAGRFADQAVLGLAPYVDPYSGGSVNLPYVPYSYTAGPYGAWVPGYVPGGTNVYAD